MNKKIIAFAIYLFLAGIFTFPLVFHLKGIFIGWPLDAYNYLWNIDTFWKQIHVHSNPFFTNRIFYPLGTYLVFHTYAPFISLLAGPFLKNSILFLNTLVILSPAVSAFFTYLLVLHITKKWIASLISGFVYGFSPIFFSFLISQHYYFAFAAPLLPLALLLLILFFEKRGTKYIIFLALLLWVCLFTDYYTTILLIFLIAIYFVLNFILQSKKFSILIIHSFKSLFLVFFFLIVIPSVVFVNFIKKIPQTSSFYNQENSYPIYCSAEPIKFFIPSAFNPVLKNMSNHLETIYKIDTNYDTPSIYLGISVLLLSLLSIFYVKPKKFVPIFGFGIFVFLFTLGPRVPFFFSTIVKLPFLGLIDCPQRYVIGVQFVLSILTGLTFAAFASYKLPKLVIGIISLIIFIEYMNFNLPSSTIQTPQAYKTLASINSSKTVLELPSGIADSKKAFGYDWSLEGLLLKQMYWQTIHKKPRIGGYTSRLDRTTYEYFKNEKVISSLFQMTSLDGYWNGEPITHKDINEFVDKFNLGFIVLSPNDRQTMFSYVVESLFSQRIVQKITEANYILYILN